MDSHARKASENLISDKTGEQAIMPPCNMQSPLRLDDCLFMLSRHPGLPNMNSGKAQNTFSRRGGWH